MPFTIAAGIRAQEQIDSFMELPDEKRPPRSIWHNSYKVEQWFERVFKSKSEASGQTTYINLEEIED